MTEATATTPRPVTDAPYPVPPFAEACIEAAGTLDSDRFRFYQMQDARYLEAFSDAAALISTRCVAPDDKLWFIDAARMALVVEGELHAGYGEQLGYGPGDIAALELTPNNKAYQDHMIATAQTGSLVEAVAALTPCPWLYIELGQHLLDELGSIADDHPYADWLRMYSDPGFNEYMENILQRLQRFADAADDAARTRAQDAFRMSARYEWMFWQQAWERQEWRV